MRGERLTFPAAQKQDMEKKRRLLKPLLAHQRGRRAREGKEGGDFVGRLGRGERGIGKKLNRGGLLGTVSIKKKKIRGGTAVSFTAAKLTKKPKKPEKNQKIRN